MAKSKPEARPERPREAITIRLSHQALAAAGKEAVKRKLNTRGYLRELLENHFAPGPTLNLK